MKLLQTVRSIPSLESSTRQPSLLIADGDSELANRMQRFFFLRSYEVEAVSDGLECMARIRRMKPDVLVLDIQLPWGGGDGVLSCLLEESEVLPAVILTTSSAASHSLLLPPDRVVFRYLHKPFHLDTLLRCVRTVQSLPLMERLKDLDVGNTSLA